MLKKVKTSLLEIAYEEKGKDGDAPVILMHGFPDDAQTWNQVTDALVENGYQTFAPYTRGYDETRFLDEKTMRSGESVAYAQDIIEFADALGINQFTFVGHDWGAAAVYLLAILYPERLKNVVICSAGYGMGLHGYADKPMSVRQIKAYWYQWHFNFKKGPETLATKRDEFCRELWKTWSPSWNFSDEEFKETSQSWNNPDFQSIVIHSYRFRYENAEGDPRYKDLTQKLLGEPPITIPTIVLHGAEDGATLVENSEGKEKHFTDFYERKVLDGIGHFVQRENPQAVIDSVIKLNEGK